MSSREQFKNALKSRKHIIVGMRDEIKLKDQYVSKLKKEIMIKDDLIRNLHETLRKTKRWYQIFIKYPIV